MSRRASFFLTCFFVFPAMGCGERLIPVQGVVNLDGVAVSEATVVFLSEDGKRSFSGFSDEQGNFVLSSNAGLGALAGKYKVTVVKAPKTEGKTDVKGDSPEYAAMMQKSMKENQTATGGQMTPKGMGGPVGPPMAKGPASKAAGPKSQLPAIYATAEKTTLTVIVPSATSPLTLDLKSKP